MQEHQSKSGGGGHYGRFMAMVGTFDWELRYTPYPGGAPIDFGGTCEFHPGFGDTWIFGNWYMPGDDESMFLDHDNLR